jgi:hypothetical protein
LIQISQDRRSSAEAGSIPSKPGINPRALDIERKRLSFSENGVAAGTQEKTSHGHRPKLLVLWETESNSGKASCRHRKMRRLQNTATPNS